MNVKHNEELEASAVEFITLLNSEKYSEAYELLDNSMKDAILPEQFKQIWLQSMNQLGGFKNIVSSRTKKNIVFLNCDFGIGNMDIAIIVFKTKKIGAFNFTQPNITDTTSDEEETLPDNIIEEEIFIGTDEWKLPGTLTLPKNKNENLTAVILVHGSGQNDRDETIYANKPFRDLAYGLAQKGIAVLRYDKRTNIFGREMPDGKPFTVQTEVIDDVLKAADFLKQETK
jgi:hypothetical protein